MTMTTSAFAASWAAKWTRKRRRFLLWPARCPGRRALTADAAAPMRRRALTETAPALDLTYLVQTTTRG